MDVLYYIGGGSHYQNRELRYSLRALAKHCKDVGNVWIVGNRPAFLANNIKYLWIEDSGMWWQNAFHKTMAAIEAGISENFLLMNDDFYMLKNFTAATYPHYHKGDIHDCAQNKYQQVIVNTKRVLQSLGKPTKHYGVHCPMRINGGKYKHLKQFFDDKSDFGAVSARCLYGNLFCHGRQASDNKGREVKNSSTGCFSSKDWTENGVFERLQELYPEPSPWENDED